MMMATTNNSIMSASKIRMATALVLYLFVALSLLDSPADAFTTTFVKRLVMVGSRDGAMRSYRSSQGSKFVQFSTTRTNKQQPLFLSQSNSDHDDEDMRKRIELTNRILKEASYSFRTVEGSTDELLEKQPMIAIAIFVALGLIVAYITGFVIMGGYISSVNPAENGAIPYWDELTDIPPLP